jgi:hypothetical protein
MNILTNAFAFDPQNISMLALQIAGGLSIGLAVILMFDVLWDGSASRFAKLAWVTLILSLPILGALFYGLASLVAGLRNARR